MTLAQLDALFAVQSPREPARRLGTGADLLADAGRWL